MSVTPIARCRCCRQWSAPSALVYGLCDACRAGQTPEAQARDAARYAQHGSYAQRCRGDAPMLRLLP